MSNGWYKQSRSYPERPWFKDASMVQLYDYLKSVAYVTDGRYDGQIIRRGSCPTTRAEMMEATGMSYKKVDRCLNALKNYGEILLKGNNRFTVVTICDYDGLPQQETLFDTNSVQPRNSQGDNEGTTEGIAEGTTHLLTKEERRKNNLISLNQPYKKERENVGYEIKRLYNATFAGILPPLMRLSTLMRLSCEECVRRFGRQSVDLVFEQIKQEPFSMGKGKNRTGFIADFSFIFTPANFQKYLERATLRRQKQQASQPQTEQPEPQPTPEEAQEKRREDLQRMVDYLRDNPRSACRAAVKGAYESGELQRLNITFNANELQLS